VTTAVSVEESEVLSPLSSQCLEGQEVINMYVSWFHADLGIQ